jgi:nucleoside 2-deoxyribosyltransferase
VCPVYKELEIDRNTLFRLKVSGMLNYDLTYYLSGPMSGYAYSNYEAFHRASMLLREGGLIIESPAENGLPPADVLKEDHWSWYMAEALNQLQKCDGIILMKGWPQSQGARIELSSALGMGMPVYFLNSTILYSMNRT